MKVIVSSLLLGVLVSCTEPAPELVSRPAGPVKPASAKLPAPVKKPAVKPGSITGIEMGQLFTMLQSGQVYLMDVRPPLFFLLGHIDGAVSFPLIKYDKSLANHHAQIKAALEAGKTIVLYCQNVNCPDAYKTAQKLVKLGHSVSIYKGGWEEWKRAGF